MRWTVIALIVCLVLLSIPFVLHLNKSLVISTYNKYRVVFLDGGGENCLNTSLTWEHLTAESEEVVG